MIETKQLPFVRLRAEKLDGVDWRVTFEDRKYVPDNDKIYQDGALKYRSMDHPEFREESMMFFMTGRNSTRQDIILTDYQWEFVKNPSITDGLKEIVELPWVTLVGIRKLGKVAISCKDIKYTNHAGKVGRHGLTHFYQLKTQSTPAYLPNYCVSTFYLPTVENHDYSVMIPSKAWSMIKAGDDAISLADRNLYVFDYDYALTCKEQALANWETKKYQDASLNITGQFPDTFLDQMAQWQRNIPNPAEIKMFPNHVNVRINNWWREPGKYYLRTGFLLLAIRLAQKRESFFNFNSLLKTKFEAFVNGEFDMPEGRSMSGSLNWVKTFQ